MRLLVCGSRVFVWYDIVKYYIQLLQPDVIIEGEAKGADTLARRVANELGIKVAKFPADWKKYGKAAGPKRNKQMLDEGKPDMVLAFPLNLATSKGTKNMIEQARAANIPVKVVEVREFDI